MTPAQPLPEDEKNLLGQKFRFKSGQRGVISLNSWTIEIDYLRNVAKLYIPSLIDQTLNPSFQFDYS